MKLPRVQAALVNELVANHVLSEEAAESLCSTEGEMSGTQLETLLREKYEVGPFPLLIAKSKAFKLAPFNVHRYRVNEKTWEKLDQDIAVECGVLPVAIVGGFLIVAVSDPFDTVPLNKIREASRLPLRLVLGLKEAIDAKIEKKAEQPVSEGYGDVMESLDVEFGVDEGGEIDETDLEEESAPIIKLASRIVEESYYAGGSDIHLEPFENEVRIRLRVDGVCQEKLRLPKKVGASLMARFKVMANLDIAEKRLPQDGRIIYKQFNRKGIDVDLRVSTAPLNHGEGAVMRILDKQKSTLPLPALGFSEENLARYRDLIKRPYGMILHCGPTGSGKSMTLYSALGEINDPGKCIRTAEDPIEYTLDGLLQMQMNRKIGLTFASALRAFLRQDPDIILVGEIRDRETAHIAVEAALTGHMLFSTLHTNDAPSTVSRLTEMGVEPFMISASIVCVCSQRLLRRVCKTCKRPVEPDSRQREILERAIEWNGEIFMANKDGCPACNGVGYKGRVGVHELMHTNMDLIQGINGAYETAKLKKICIRNGMKTLHQDSLLKVKDGVTTLEEAVANLPADLEDTIKIRNAKTLEEALAD